MKKWICSLALLLFIQTAWGLPTPMTQDQLWEKSDFIGTIKILGVLRVQDHQMKSFDSVPAYQAWAQIINVDKGKIDVNASILISWHELVEGTVGGWFVGFKPGEKARVHLKKIGDVYTATYYQGKEILSEGDDEDTYAVGQVQFK